jgi:alkylation response protein AidB-like acyl-CoA dehydrogenase
VDFSLSTEQRALRQRVRAFAGEQLGKDVLDDDRESRFPAADWRRCAEFGVLGWPVPRRYGGGELDPLSTIVALEALGYGCADNGLVFAVNNHLWGCVIYLLTHGTEAQKRCYLPRLCDGSSIGAQALSEPEAGSDVLSLQTTARRRGDEYVLEGTKWFVSNGPVANLFIVFARTGEGRTQDALTAFVVSDDLPGVRKTREFAKLGLRTTPMGAVEFHDCRVPAQNLLGREGGGYSVFTSTIEWERTFMLAGQVGAMERLLEASLQHATSRRQFGRPIGTFQAVAHQVVDMKVRLELARLILYRVGWLKREGKIAILDSAIAKIFISESAVQTALAAVEVHGARGYLADWEIERELRDAVGTGIYGGTSSVQRGIVAELIGLTGALAGPGDGR